MSQVQAPKINAPAVSQVSTAATAAASSATTALNAQAVATGNVTKAQGQQASASAAVITAQRALTAATSTLDEALAAEVVNEKAVATATEQVSIVTARLAAAQARLSTTTAAVAAEEALLARGRLASAGATSVAIGQNRLLQAGLQGAGQGALSSRLAFFGLGGAIAAVGIGAFAVAVKGAANFEQAMNTLGVVTGATEAQLQQAGQTALQLGADITLPSVSATDASEAILTLARTGIVLQDSISGARGVLQLAAAAQTDNATAAITVARALNAFSLSGSKATHVADLLTGASIAGGASIQDMAVALQQSSAAAAQVGISLEDTTTLLGILAKNGLAGSDAGTSLRTTILRLIPTTKEAKDAMAALGVSVTDSSGALLPTAQILENFKQSLAGLPPTLRQVVLETIAGSDGFRALSIFAREGAAGFDVAARATDRQGIAAKVAAARTSGLKGQFDALKSNAETLGVELGTKLIPVANDLVTALNGIVTAAGFVASALAALPGSDVSGIDLVKKLFGSDFDPEKTAAELKANAAGAKAFQDALDKIRGIAPENLNLKGLNDFQKALVGIRADARQEDFHVVRPLGIRPADTARIKAQVQRLKETLGQAGFEVGENFRAKLEASLTGVSNDKLFGAIKAFSVAALLPGGAEAVGNELALDLTTDVQNAQELAISNALKRAELSGNLQEQVRVIGNQITNYRAELSKVVGNTAAAKAERERLRGLILDGEKDQQALIDEQNDKARQTREDARNAIQISLQGVFQNALATPGIADDVAAKRAEIAAFAAALNALNNDVTATKSQIATAQTNLDQARRELDAIFADHAKELQSDAADRQNAIGIALQRSIDKALRAGREDDAIKGYRTQIDRLDAAIKRAEADTTSTLSDIETLKNARFEVSQKLQDALDGPDKETIFERLEARLQNNLKASGLTEGLSDDIRDATRLVNLYRDRLAKIAKEQGANSLAAQAVRSQFIDAKAQLASLQKETDDSGATGTTAFSLLKQAAETFAANAGNLIGGNQPFAGPTGFTADLSQFLKRATPPQLPLEDHIRFGARQAQEERRTNRLIDALDGLTAAVNNQSGNVAAGVPTQAGGTPTWRSFYISRQTRDAQQARNV